MNGIISSSLEVERFIMIIMSAFAAMVMVLVAVGIYGVMSYIVEQRIQEIGIRIALGVALSQARNMVVRHGLTLIIAGVGIGVCTAWELALLLQAFLFGV